MLALQKTLRDGRRATVTIESRLGQAVSVAAVNGTEVGRHIGPHHWSPNLPDGYTAAIGQLALTTDEASAVSAAYKVFRAQLPTDLVAQRRQLVEAVSAAVTAENDVRQAVWESFDGTGNPIVDYSIVIDEARAQLATFDAQHSDVAATARQERQEMIQQGIAD